MSRDYEPVVGQWYENLEEEESFRVLSVDEDSELVEIEYLDGDIEELDIEAWHEMDLDRIEEPEGWSEPDDEKTMKMTRTGKRTKTRMTMTWMRMTTRSMMSGTSIERSRHR